MLFLFKFISLILILIITVIAGYYPFAKKHRSHGHHHGQFPIGESLAAGVFLGAGLMHMLGSASQSFYSLHDSYPWAFLIAGAMFLILLLLEHVGREVFQKRGEHSGAFACIATLMLSIHSFLMGAALGLSSSLSVMIVILLAILAHKWAASFALAVRINQSDLKLKQGLWLFAIFATMTPLGILSGHAATVYLGHHALIQPIFSALAAGTFLYLGTLHGLEKATLIKQCCDLNRYYYVILGFAIMAVVAIWT